MNQQEILKKIGGIIAELKDQHGYLETARSSFNDLELELFMANANFLTDHIAILQKISQQQVPGLLSAEKPVLQIETTPAKPQIPDYFDEQELLSAEKEPFPFKNTSAEIIEPPLEEVEKPRETIILPEAMPEIKAAEVLAEDASFIDPKIEPVEDTSFIGLKPESVEAVAEDASFIDPKTEPVEAVAEDAAFIDPKTEPKPDLQSEVFELNEAGTQRNVSKPETISLNIGEDESSFGSAFSLQESSMAKSTEPVVLTLNDRIAAQKGLDQPKSKTENQPKTVQDLQSMISLNDKLLFVKELFNGYNLAYAEAINILNRYTKFEQAEHFLNLNYTVKNNWKDKPATTEKFMDLLRKKLS